MITQKRVRELFVYNHATGKLTNREYRNYNSHKGDEAGCTKTSDGYSVVYVNGRLYPTHRVIWLYVHGYLPKEQLDHINRDKLDNRLCNIREVSNATNSRNQKKRANNTSGVTGVSWHKIASKWRVRLANKHLGLYSTLEEATQVRQYAIKMHGDYTNTHGKVI